MELARAQRTYAEVTASPDASEHLINRAWLGLWRAERRRDELLRLGTVLGPEGLA